MMMWQQEPSTRTFRSSAEDSPDFTAEDVERMNMRLDGLEAYILVGALVSTTSFNDVLGSDFLTANGSLPYFCRYVTLIVSAMVTLLGLYATIIFASTILYGKTAMGLNRDRMFMHFMDKTRGQRIRGFNALAACIVLFGVEVCLIVADRIPDPKLVPPVLLVSAVIIYFGVNDFRTIIDSAGPIFTNVIPGDDDTSKKIT